MQPTQLPLKDVHLPATIGWWPPAIGWWILAALLMALLLGSILAYKRITRPSALKSAKKLLLILKEDAAQDNFEKLCQLSILMRRVAMSEYPRAETANLTGDAWLAFLDRAVEGTPFSTGLGRSLADAPFRKVPPSDADISNLMRLCEDWFKALAKQKK